jgi:hypothetical protein
MTGVTRGKNDLAGSKKIPAWNPISAIRLETAEWVPTTFETMMHGYFSIYNL